MSDRTRDAKRPASRLIGRYGGDHGGPAVLCVAGIHGNEPAGVEALQRVFDRLEALQPPCRGELVGLAGNLQALAQGTRYIDNDLNRMWRPDIMERIADQRGDVAEAESAELRGLHHAMRTVADRRRGTAYFLDLHTTSSRTAPFAVINDTLPNRSFARNFPVPVVLGLEEHVEGAIADYAHQLGCITLGFEAGRHDDPQAVHLHEALVWLALVAAGVLEAESVPDLEQRRRTLAEASRGLPRYVEVLERHELKDGADFRMMAGYENFQPVDCGELLAHEHRSGVKANETALLFMPLYQAMGDDGFFLTRPVKAFWLGLSTVMRRMHLEHLLPLLPGVSRHPTMDNAVAVEPRIARWYVSEIFHLLGYRRRHAENGRLVFTRRLHDHAN